MKIEINVGDVDLTSEIGTRSYVDEDGDLCEGAPITLADLLVKELVSRAVRDDASGYPGLKQRAADVRDEEIRAHVVPLIGEAFETPIQRTNTWGEPAGEPLQLRDVVIDEARKILRGTGDRSSYGNGREPLARTLIREMVDRELRRELADVIKTEREKVVAAVRAQAADLIAKSVAEGVGGSR